MRSRRGSLRVFAEVDEKLTTQTCSACLSVNGPKGHKGLAIRQWVCGECGTVHDRDGNAAINIARLGCEALGLCPGSPAFHGGGASPHVVRPGGGENPPV